ncbi:MAG: hypothetical protein KC776_24085 [Myxococcales bacterium]|nr:hypothetical protein [Myxococcales bacterium]MCB9583082.1 hypothetical protein [Polyangiaceae bacterium]
MDSLAHLKTLGSIVFAVGLAAACSAAGGGDDPKGGSGGGGSSGSGNTGNTGNTGGGATGGGGGLDLDSGSTGGTGGTTDPGDAACQSFTQEAKQLYEPADIIWAVDTSGSMLEEAAAVQQNINAFSQQIVASGIDVHVVMLAGYQFLILPGICVPGPLGSGQCPPNGSDTNLPHFFHHPNAFIDSVDAARQLVERFPEYKQMLRPGALKYVVVVTDDDSRTGTGSGGTGDPGPYDNNPDKFIQDFTNLDPMLSNGGQPNWKLSAVYSFTQCPNAAAVGQVWKAIVNKTGGVHGDICNCTNAALCAQTFQTVFNELATKIIQGAQPLTCEWQIPAPPAGQKLDPTKVNVEFINQVQGTQETIYHVDGASSCDPTLGGWYYNDNNFPTSVKACPATCSKITAVTTAKINVLFGCATQNIPR